LVVERGHRVARVAAQLGVSGHSLHYWSSMRGLKVVGYTAIARFIKIWVRLVKPAASTVWPV